MTEQQNSSLIRGIQTRLEQQFQQHKILEQLAEQIQLVENLNTLSLSKNKRLANDSMQKIRQIYKVADLNNIDVIESLNNYFTLTAQNDVFDNIKHLQQDLLNGIHDPDAELQ